VLATHQLPATRWRLLAGLRVPFSASFNENGAAGDTELSLKTSPGVVLGGEWMLGNLGLRVSGALGEKYRPKGSASSADKKGDHVGFYMGYYFR
jgi:hypothetical protein